MRRRRVTPWRRDSTEMASGNPGAVHAAGVFGSEAKAGSMGPTVDLKALHAKIGELTLENDFLEGALGKAGMLSAKR